MPQIEKHSVLSDLFRIFFLVIENSAFPHTPPSRYLPGEDRKTPAFTCSHCDAAKSRLKATPKTVAWQPEVLARVFRLDHRRKEG